MAAARFNVGITATQFFLLRTKFSPFWSTQQQKNGFILIR